MVAQRYLLEQSQGPSACRRRAHPGQDKRCHHVLHRRQARNQVERLEDHANRRRRYCTLSRPLRPITSVPPTTTSPCVGVSSPPTRTATWSCRSQKALSQPRSGLPEPGSQVVDGPGPMRSEGVLDGQPLDVNVGCGCLAPLRVRRLCRSNRGFARHRTDLATAITSLPPQEPPVCGNIAFRRGVWLETQRAVDVRCCPRFAEPPFAPFFGHRCGAAASTDGWPATSQLLPSSLPRSSWRLHRDGLDPVLSATDGAVRKSRYPWGSGLGWSRATTRPGESSQTRFLQQRFRKPGRSDRDSRRPRPRGARLRRSTTTHALAAHAHASFHPRTIEGARSTDLRDHRFRPGRPGTRDRFDPARLI